MISNFQLAFLYIFVAGIFSATNPPAHAQESEVSFSIITLSELTYENLYIRNGKSAVQLELRNSRRSKPQTIKATEFFEIYTTSDDPEEKYKLIGKTKFPTGTRKALFFIRKAISGSEEPELPLDIFGIDDSSATFPKSSFRFANFTSVPLTINIGKEGAKIQPKEFKVRKVKVSEKGEFTPFLIRNLAGETIGGTRLFSHSSSREIVLIFPPKNTQQKKLDIRFFSD